MVVTSTETTRCRATCRRSAVAVRDGLLAEPIRADAAGTIAVPDSPGLGIEIDEDKLKRYGEKFFDMTTRGIAVKTIREKGLFAALRLARRKKRRM